MTNSELIAKARELSGDLIIDLGNSEVDELLVDLANALEKAEEGKKSLALALAYVISDLKGLRFSIREFDVDEKLMNYENWLEENTGRRA